MDFSRIKNIIFDLGGVIINIDLMLTYNALAQYCPLNEEEVKQKLTETEVFSKYEKGVLSSADARKLLNKTFHLSLSDEDMDKCWNALLLDIPTERIELLKNLRKKYKLFLLSNTNEIHIDEVNAILYRATGIKKLDELFDKIYYSFDIKMAKPSTEIYYHVLKENNLVASETLFLDDNVPNLAGAKLAGIHTVQVTTNNSITELLKDAL